MRARAPSGPRHLACGGRERGSWTAARARAAGWGLTREQGEGGAGRQGKRVEGPVPCPPCGHSCAHEVADIPQCEARPREDALNLALHLLQHVHSAADGLLPLQGEHHELDHGWVRTAGRPSRGCPGAHREVEGRGVHKVEAALVVAHLGELRPQRGRQRPDVLPEGVERDADEVGPSLGLGFHLLGGLLGQGAEFVDSRCHGRLAGSRHDNGAVLGRGVRRGCSGARGSAAHLGARPRDGHGDAVRGFNAAAVLLLGTAQLPVQRGIHLQRGSAGPCSAGLLHLQGPSRGLAWGAGEFSVGNAVQDDNGEPGLLHVARQGAGGGSACEHGSGAAKLFQGGPADE